MKQFLKKRVLAFLCIMTCMLSMTACAENLGEKMANAAVNTLIGMGIVFAVLLLMVWLISLFKYVPILQVKFEALEKWVANLFSRKSQEVTSKTTPETKSQEMVSETVVEEAVEENLIDDLELVAVITAAIAAMENTSADGLVVRSIKRSANSKWKRS